MLHLVLAIAVGSAGATQTKIAFGSCNDHDAPSQTLWKDIVQEKPQVFAWLGDIVYGDTQVNHFHHEPASPEILQTRYRMQKERPDYQELVQSKHTKIVGIYDDHDYGFNNAGIDFYMKEDSQRLLLDFLDEPVDSPRRSQKGAYASYIIGDEPGKLVKLILLDTRFFMETNGKDDADILGQEQWKWLANEFMTSNAQVHIIASGIQTLPDNKDWFLNWATKGKIVIETWGKFPKAKAQLLQMLADYNVARPLFISGDIHFSEISELKNWAGSYPLYEVTSSGMTHSWGYDFEGTKPGFFLWQPLFDYVALISMPAALRIPGDEYSMLSWGMITVDWDEGIISLQVRGENGLIALEERLDLMTLSRLTVTFKERMLMFVQIIAQIALFIALIVYTVHAIRSVLASIVKANDKLGKHS